MSERIVLFRNEMTDKEVEEFVKTHDLEVVNMGLTGGKTDSILIKTPIKTKRDKLLKDDRVSSIDPLRNRCSCCR